MNSPSLSTKHTHFMPEKSIVLVGMMGVGKSSVGEYLAQLTQLPFYDADEEIQKAAQKSIPRIFEEKGEAYFRKLERKTIQKLLQEGPIILATGGGAFMDEQTRDVIEERGTSVWLHCEPEQLFERIGQCQERPLIAQEEDPLGRLKELARIRDPFYQKADIRIDSDTSHEQETAYHIIEALTRRHDMTCVPIHLPQGKSYNILIGSGLIATLGNKIRALSKSKSCFVITDDNVAPHYLKPLQQSLEEASFTPKAIVIPAGEASKCFNMYEDVTSEILKQGVTRKTPILALGGGVVGDLTGFAAATLLRGVPFIQIPTTLLSQVDSSVGGKTGIDTPFGKNLLGAFYQPLGVFTDVSALDTLPLREIQAGYGEIVKCALIGDPEFFSWCVENATRLLKRDPSALIYAIKKACLFKADVVSQDEKENKKDGGRILLNLGHTFAHALETEIGYGDKLLHGEAVLIGINLAFALSVKLGLCPPQDYERVLRHFKTLNMRVHIRDLGQKMSSQSLLEHMRFDKKNSDGSLNCVLVRGIGKAFVYKDVPIGQVAQILREDGAT